MSKNLQIAQDIKATADQLGWQISIVGAGIMRITKRIRGNDEFVKADMEYYSILGKLPTTSAGSIWGTDGGGIGALSAMNSGVFTMNKSGGSTRVINQLKKII